MKDSGSGFGGIIAAIIAILGILFLTGVVGPTAGLIGKLFKLAGAACIVAGVGILALVVAAVVASIMSNKPDENMDTKAAVNQSITERRAQLAKLKSSLNVLKMDRSRVSAKINDVNRQVDLCMSNARRYVEMGNEEAARNELTKKQNLLKSKENLTATEEGYNQSIDQVSTLVTKLENEISDMELRRSSANAKLKMAQAKQSMSDYQTTVEGGNQESLGELEQQAQFQADYAEALEKLKNQQYSSDLPTDKYDIGEEKVESVNSAVDEELAQLKSSKLK